MDLTEDILTEIRETSGIGKNVINDPSLTVIWEQLDGLNAQLEEPRGVETLKRAVIARMFERILNNAVKLHDYKMGTHSETLSQVYQQVKDAFERYRKDLEAINSEVSRTGQPVFGQVKPFRTEESKPLPRNRDW